MTWASDPEAEEEDVLPGNRSAPTGSALGVAPGQTMVLWGTAYWVSHHRPRLLAGPRRHSALSSGASTNSTQPHNYKPHTHIPSCCRNNLLEHNAQKTTTELRRDRVTAEHFLLNLTPATSMGDEVAPEVYRALRRSCSIDNFDAALVAVRTFSGNQARGRPEG